MDSHWSSVKDLLPEGIEMTPLIPYFNGIVILVIALMVFVSQIASRIYISCSSNHQQLIGYSNELVSNSVLAMAILFRLFAVAVGTISGSFYVKAYLHSFGFCVFLPLVVLLNHQNAKKYFGKKNPRIKKFFSKFNKIDPDIGAQINPNQASPAPELGEIHSIQEKIQPTRLRSKSFQSENCVIESPTEVMKKSFSYPCLTKAQNISKVIEVNANAAFLSKSEYKTPLQKGNSTKKSYSVVEMPVVEIP